MSTDAAAMSVPAGPHRATAAAPPGGVGLRGRIGVLLRGGAALVCGLGRRCRREPDLLHRVDLLHAGGVHPVEPERPEGTPRPDEPRRSGRLVGGRHPVRRHAPLQHLDRCRARRGDRPTRCRRHRLAARRVGVPRVPRVEHARRGRDQGSRPALGRRRAHLARHLAEPRGVGRVRRLGGRRLRHAGHRRLRERVLGEPRHRARCGLLLRRGAAVATPDHPTGTPTVPDAAAAG